MSLVFLVSYLIPTTQSIMMVFYTWYNKVFPSIFFSFMKLFYKLFEKLHKAKNWKWMGKNKLKLKKQWGQKKNQI